LACYRPRSPAAKERLRFRSSRKTVAVFIETAFVVYTVQVWSRSSAGFAITTE
jgi:hypothetical protein